MMKQFTFFLLIFCLSFFFFACQQKEKTRKQTPTPIPKNQPSTVIQPGDTTNIIQQLGLLAHPVENPLYRLQLQLSDLDCSVHLNGVLLFQTLHGRPQSAQVTSLNPWIMPGNNQLEIFLDSLSFKSMMPERQALLTLWPSAETGSDTLQLWKVLFQENDSTPGLPIRYIVDFQVDVPVPGKFWQESEPLTLDIQTKREANGIVRKLHTAIAEKDVATFIDMLGYQIDEMQQVYYYSDEFKTNWAGSVENRLQSIRVFRLDTTEYSYHLVANDKVLEVKAQGQSPVRTPDGQSRIPILLGKTKGKLRIVR